ncbi:hypothetical protein ACFPER_04310 [Agromyces aurantiacus]|uniref:Uncharacterized protein n=1 Tax=Agromyces aurantiacus TaxID=165814 RepID=A0ABV9R421_9MICO|nr:hypothetical protein [Agromyces aurantiacus]MBM7502680.1 hypothetical protein [Agromyces aurantiacus]
MRHQAHPLGERRAAIRSTARRSARAPRRRSVAALAATAAVGSLLATIALAPLPRPSVAVADQAAAALSPFSGAVQQVEVPGDIAPAGVSTEDYSAATGPDTLVASGTNYDWAKLVLVFGGWPLTDENVTLMVQWMREENGPDNWWNRNNPMNNGYGSGGGSGLGSYATLVDAARYAADNLKKRSFYVDIVAGLEAGTSAATTAQAIWASPWASSHYGYGTWWSTSPVPVVTAPASAWGR